MRLIPKHWREFQHYTDRRPPWIKLHRRLLDDRAYLALPCAARAIAPLLWLLASESEDGSFDADTDELAFRLRLPRKELQDGVNALVESRFLVASTPLASCEQLAPESVLSASVLSASSVEGEREREAADFQRFWEAYGKQVDKVKAMRAWAKLRPDIEMVNLLIERATKYRDATPDKTYRKHPATWLNGRCWEDEIVQPPKAAANGTTGPKNTEPDFSKFDYGKSRKL